MRLVATFALVCLLLMGCDRRDARFREKLVGTWVLDNSGVMVIRSYGSWYSQFTAGSASQQKEVVFQGMWIVKDGYFVSTTTNIVNPQSLGVVPPGRTDRLKIIKLDDAVLEGRDVRFDQKISWKRKT